MVQAVPLELQWCFAPVLLTASTWEYWASGLRDQDTFRDPSAHCATTATSLRAQGAEEGKGREKQRDQVNKNGSQIMAQACHKHRKIDGQVNKLFALLI